MVSPVLGDSGTHFGIKICMGKMIAGGLIVWKRRERRGD